MPIASGFVRNVAAAVIAAVGTFSRKLVSLLGYVAAPADFENDISPWLETRVLGLAMIDIVGWALISVAAVMIAWPWLGRKFAASPAEPSSSSTPAAASEVYNVASHGQSGGITAGKLVNQAPKPRLRVRQEEPVAIGDGTYSTTAIVDVDSPYPPANLYLEVRSTSILEFQCVPDKVGVTLGGHTGTRPGRSFTNIINPSGSYRLTVRTSDPTRPQIGYAFD